MDNATWVTSVAESRCAFVTTLCGGGYLSGAIALARSLKFVGSGYPLVACCSGCSSEELRKLEGEGVIVSELREVLPPEIVVNLNRNNGFERWDHTFSKLSLLGLNDFDKLVMVDSDMLFVQNADELFDRPSMSAVAAGHGAHQDWVDLNSGLMVIEPSDRLYGRALDILNSLTKEDLVGYQGLGDQDILTLLIPDWKVRDSLHLSECYNAFQDCLAFYDASGYLPYDDVKVVHFELTPKPWDYGLCDWARILKRAIKMRSKAEIKAARAYLNII